jgi:hypothetical protein
MEMITIDTLGAMQRRGYGLFGWCGDCGAPSSYWMYGAHLSARSSILTLQL